jgi:hypothetical protein
MREAMAALLNCLAISLPICLLHSLASSVKQWRASCIVSYFIAFLFSGLLQCDPLASN